METAAEELCHESGMAENSERETSAVCYRRERKEPPWKRGFIYLQCCEYRSSSSFLSGFYHNIHLQQTTSQ